MNSFVMVILLAMLMQSSPEQDARINGLELKRLDTLIELAEVRRDCARIEGSLAKLDEGKLDAVSDKTLEQLKLQLNAAEKSLRDLQSNAQESSDERKKLIDFAELRVISLSESVRDAQTNLREYFKKELGKARGDEQLLLAKLKDIQAELDRPLLKPSPPEPPPPAPVPTPTPVPTPEPPTGGGQSVTPAKPGDLKIGEKDKQQYVYVPAGSFQMGCAATDRNCDKHDEMPAHQVTLTKGFWLGQTEVMVQAYQAFTDAIPDRRMPVPPPSKADWKETADPISNVTYDDAASYCQWAGGHLPSEAEWEYAARAGSSTIYPWGDVADHEHANFFGTSKDRRTGRDKFEFTANVKSFPANAWGIFDMLGNVAEFVADFYSTYGNEPVIDPKGPANGEERIVRGGSWGANASQLRTSRRERVKPAFNGNYVGFRCVLDTPAR